MPGLALHATAVAIGGDALLIRGRSRAGKSCLAAALIARSTARRPTVLVGDDRVMLEARGDILIVRPHPRIAGFLERRGLGIVAMPWIAEAPVRGCVELGDGVPEVAALGGLRLFKTTEPLGRVALADAVFLWWTTPTSADGCGATRTMV